MAQKFGHHLYSPVDAQQIAQSLRMIGHNLQKSENKLYSDEAINGNEEKLFVQNNLYQK